MSRRGERKALLKMLPKESTGAYIGVWRGGLTGRMLNIVEPRMLYLIDPWAWKPEEFPDRAYGGGNPNVQSQDDMDKMYRKVREKWGSLKNVRICRNESDLVLGNMPDRAFDWVYIDGNHNYDYVKRDLENAMRIVKDGGWICGDDVWWDKAQEYPVQRAVIEMVHANIGRAFLRRFDSQFMIRLFDENTVEYDPKAPIPVDDADPVDVEEDIALGPAPESEEETPPKAEKKVAQKKTVPKKTTKRKTVKKKTDDK